MAAQQHPKPIDYKPVLPASATTDWLKRHRLLGIPGVQRKNDIFIPGKGGKSSYASVFQVGTADDNLPIRAGMSANNRSDEENKREAERSRRVRDAARRRVREQKGFTLPEGHPEVVVPSSLTAEEWRGFVTSSTKLNPSKPRIMVSQDNTIDDPRTTPNNSDRGYAYEISDDISSVLQDAGVLKNYYRAPSSGVIYVPTQAVLHTAPEDYRDQPAVADKRRIGELIFSNISPADRDHEFIGHSGVGFIATNNDRDIHGDMTGARAIIEGARDTRQTDANGKDTDDEYFLGNVSEFTGGARQHKDQLWNFSGEQADTFPQFIDNMVKSEVFQWDKNGNLIPGKNYDAYHPYGDDSKHNMGTDQYIRIWNAIQTYRNKVKQNPAARDPKVDEAIKNIHSLWEQASNDPRRYRDLYRGYESTQTFNA